MRANKAVADLMTLADATPQERAALAAELGAHGVAPEAAKASDVAAALARLRGREAARKAVGHG